MNWPEAVVISVVVFSIAIVVVTWLSPSAGGTRGGDTNRSS